MLHAGSCLVLKTDVNKTLFLEQTFNIVDKNNFGLTEEKHIQSFLHLKTQSTFQNSEFSCWKKYGTLMISTKCLVSLT